MNAAQSGWLAILVLAAVPAPASEPSPSDRGAWTEVLAWSGKHASSALVVAEGPRILAEARWDRPGSRVGTTPDGWPIEDVASVQKSITSVLVVVAREQGRLGLDDPVVRWLGPGWSRAPADGEAAITVRHLLTMTSGLREDLTAEAAPGTRWRYNTPAYSRLLAVLAAAAGRELPDLTRQWLTGPLEMRHSRWERRPGPAAALNPWGFLTTAHDLLRFGRMILAGGRPVVRDCAGLEVMLQPTRDLNPDYGGLWWLNSSAVPGRAGRRIPSAPAGLFAAEGARDCRLYLLPERDLIVVRLGEPAGKGFAEGLWDRLIPALGGP